MQTNKQTHRPSLSQGETGAPLYAKTCSIRVLFWLRNAARDGWRRGSCLGVSGLVLMCFVFVFSLFVFLAFFSVLLDFCVFVFLGVQFCLVFFYLLSFCFRFAFIFWCSYFVFMLFFFSFLFIFLFYFWFFVCLVVVVVFYI